MVSEIKKIFTVLRTVKVFLLKKTIFNLPEECFVMTSASMSRVIFNLMKNAAEATPVNGIIEINLVVINSKAVFSVTNEGEAISEVDMNRIWEPFYSKKAQGRGFGLKIVSKILNSQNITPYIESNNEKTTFLFEMELSRLS